MLGIRLKSLRNKLNFTQAQMAEKIGVARTTYAMYEQEKREPDTDILLKIAEFHSVTTDYLLGRTDNPQASQNESNNSLDQINNLLKKYNIDQSGFFDIEKWKNMGPEEIKQLESYFEFIVQEAEKKNKQQD